MKKLFLFLLCVFVVVFFASTNVLAYSYTKADIPEYSLYFAEPGDTEHSITAIGDLVIGDNFVFDVWISDVPTGKQGLEACYFDIQYDPLVVTYQGFTPLAAFVGNDPLSDYGYEHQPEGWDSHGFVARQWQEPPGIDGNVPLLQLTFQCEGPGTPTLIPSWHWGYGSVDNINMFDGSSYGTPETNEPGFQGIGGQSGYAISGTVTVHGDGDAAGIAVMMTGAATGEALTDQNGDYVFEDLQDGTYTITPKEPVYGFDPGAENVEIASADAVADFDMYELLGERRQPVRPGRYNGGFKNPVRRGPGCRRLSRGQPERQNRPPRSH